MKLWTRIKKALKSYQKDNFDDFAAYIYFALLGLTLIGIGFVFGSFAAFAKATAILFGSTTSSIASTVGTGIVTGVTTAGSAAYALGSATASGALAAAAVLKSALASITITGIGVFLLAIPAIRGLVGLYDLLADPSSAEPHVTAPHTKRKHNKPTAEHKKAAPKLRDPSKYAFTGLHGKKANPTTAAKLKTPPVETKKKKRT